MTSDVSVVKCKSYDSASEAVFRALDSIKAGELIKEGMKVLIKPNILAAADPSKAVTTHPSVIDAVCSYLSRHGAKVYIGESSGSAAAHGTETAFRKSGISDIAKKWNAEFINFDEDDHIVRENSSAVVMKNIVVSKRLCGMDLVVDACKLKTHMLTGYTGAVKNMFGILPGRAKVNAHTRGKKLKDFSNILLDIYSAMKPGLCIMDAVVGMEGNGPSSGKPKKTGLIIASRDAVALDMVAARIIGFRLKELEFIGLARKRGMAPGRIRVLGGKNARVPYKKPLSYRFGLYRPIQNLVMGRLQSSFAVDRGKCRGCGYCFRACPQKSIKMEGGFPVFDKGKCIMCYCCHELCPHDAIILKKPLIARIVEKFTKRYKD